REPEIPKEYRVVHRERYPVEYHRAFVLGAEASKETISADYKNGILTVRIPKSEETKPRKIAIS
ncbi:MAG TPA: Hsp20 family protein, partial [bacterium]|nr:Hsp20 family protein [bacterium]